MVQACGCGWIVAGRRWVVKDWFPDGVDEVFFRYVTLPRFLLGWLWCIMMTWK